MLINLKPAFEALRLTHEICYNTELNNNNIYELKDYSTHRSSASRGNCTFTKGFMNGYIIHTHPFGSKAYPSSEDIISVVRHNNVEVSIIVSTIGVWELSYHGSYDLSSGDIKYLQKKINNSISLPLYDLGLNRGLDRSKPDGIESDELLKNIRKYKKNIQKIFKKHNVKGLKIRFTFIHDVPEDNIYTVNSSSINSFSSSSRKTIKKKHRRTRRYKKNKKVKRRRAKRAKRTKRRAR